MPKVNRYVDISSVDKEAKKDYIDRHSPFIHCADNATKDSKFAVTIRVGNEYTHPDDLDHYIAYIQLYNGETLLAQSQFVSGALGGQDKKGQAEVIFHIVPAKDLSLTAVSYCTKHGLWESDPKVVKVS